MFCSNCGSQINDGTKFCPNCGAPVENQASGVVPQMEQPVMTPVQPMEQPVVEPVQPMEQPVVEPVQPIEQPVVEPVQPMEQPVVEPVQPMEQPVVSPFAAPVDNTPVDPFGASMNNAPVDPFGASMNNAPADPFGASMNNAPADPFGAPANQSPQVLESYGAPAENNGQWDPLMAPAKKSKKPLIIGIIAGVVILVAAIALILILVLGGDDDDKETTKKQRSTSTTSKEVKTTEEKGTTTSSQAGVGDFEDIDEDSAKALVDKMFDKIIAEDFDEVLKLFPKGIEDTLYSDDDDDFAVRIKDLTNVDVERFGSIKSASFESSGYFYSYDEISDDQLESLPLNDNETITGFGTCEYYYVLKSNDRSAKFDLSISFGIVDGKLRLIDVYSFNSFIEDYKFTGSGDDEFGEWYDLTTSSDDDDDDDDFSDVSGNIVTAGMGADNYEELLGTGLNYFFAKDENVEKYLAPVLVAVYKETYGDDYLDELYDVADVDDVLSKEGITHNESELGESELDMYATAFAMYGVDDEIEEGYAVEATISFNGEDDRDYNLVLVKMYGKWFILDIMVA